ncbi:hypothetical protein BH09DEP1_BH09DEP1_8630 [soil metagenome]
MKYILLSLLIIISQTVNCKSNFELNRWQARDISRCIVMGAASGGIAGFLIALKEYENAHPDHTLFEAVTAMEWKKAVLGALISGIVFGTVPYIGYVTENAIDSYYNA